MELATALHHSAQPAGPVVAGPREVEEQDKYEASRRQKALPPGAHPGVLKEPEVQVRAATVGCVAAGAPSLSVVLVSGMMHDDATVQYLLKQSLLARQAELDRRKKRVEEEEEKAKEKEEELEQARRELRTLLAVPAPRRTAEQETRVRACRSVLGAAYKRKRKKRRKKKTPRASSHPSLRRAHCQQRQRYVLAGFAGYDTPRAVFPSIVNARGDSTGAVLGQGDMPVVILSGGFGQTVQKTVESPQLQLIVGRQHPLRAANADPHGSVCSADHGDSSVAAYFGGRCPCCVGSCKSSGAAVCCVSLRRLFGLRSGDTTGAVLGQSYVVFYACPVETTSRSKMNVLVAGFTGDDTSRAVFLVCLSRPRCSAPWPVWTTRNFSRFSSTSFTCPLCATTGASGARDSAGAVLGQGCPCPCCATTRAHGARDSRRWLTSLRHAATSSCSSRAENSRYAQCKLCTFVSFPQVQLLDKVVVPVVCNDNALVQMRITVEVPQLQFLDMELTCPLLCHTGAQVQTSWTRMWTCPLLCQTGSLVQQLWCRSCSSSTSPCGDRGDSTGAVLVGA